MKIHGELFFVYEMGHLLMLPQGGKTLVALDYGVELELCKRKIPFVSMRDLARSPEGEREPIEAARRMSAWYTHPSFRFFEHAGVPLGEPHAGPLYHYFGILIYYYTLYDQILSKEIIHVTIPESLHMVGVAADPTAAFRARAIVDMAKLICNERGVACTILPAPHKSRVPAVTYAVREAFVRAMFATLNAVVSIRRKRPLKLLITDPWARVEDTLALLPEAEIVMTRRKEVRNMGLRALWVSRVRFHHPLDFASASLRAQSRNKAASFAQEWQKLGEYPEIAALFSYNGFSLWPLARIVLHSLIVDHSSRAVAMIESIKELLHRYHLNRVLLFSSTKGYNNVIARVAEHLAIPSIELQHATEVTEASNPYAHLYARYLAGYGRLTKTHYEERYGIDPRRVIETGSPRFDIYERPVEPQAIEALRARLSIEHPAALIVLPDRYPALEPASYTTYSMFDLLCDYALLAKEWHLLLRPKPGSDPLYRRHEIRALVAGASWVEKENLRTLLALADIVVSGNSTIVLEGLLAHKPVILYLPRQIDGDFQEFEENGAVMRASTPEELLTHARALKNAKTRAELVSRADVFLKNNFVTHHAAENVAALLRNLPPV